jgi:hypothetical protein
MLVVPFWDPSYNVTIHHCRGKKELAKGRRGRILTNSEAVGNNSIQEMRETPVPTSRGTIGIEPHLNLHMALSLWLQSMKDT